MNEKPPTLVVYSAAHQQYLRVIAKENGELTDRWKWVDIADLATRFENAAVAGDYAKRLSASVLECRTGPAGPERSCCRRVVS